MMFDPFHRICFEGPGNSKILNYSHTDWVSFNYWMNRKKNEFLTFCKTDVFIVFMYSFFIHRQMIKKNSLC